MAIIDELIAILGYDVRGEDQLKRFNAGLDRTEKYARTAADRIGVLGVAVGSFIGAAAYEGISRLTGALTSLPGDITETGSTFEKLKVQLTGLEGSSAGAEKALAWIKKFARDTPLSLEQVTTAYANLKNFGLDPTNGTMQALVDTMAMSGKGAEQMSGIILAVGQAWSKQKLQGEEILQLVERGVPVWDLLSEATGKSVAELNKLSSAGKLGRKEIQMLIDAMGKRAAGQANKMAQTFEGITDKMSDTWQQFKLMIADAGWFDFVKKNTEELATAFDNFMGSEGAKRWSKNISDFMIGTVKAMMRLGRSVWRLGAWIGSGFEQIGKFAADALRAISSGKIDLSNWEGFAAVAAVLFAYFAPATAVIIAAGLAIDDFLTYLEGGESVIGDFIASLPEFIAAFDKIAPGVRSAVQSTIALLRAGDWAGAGVMASEAFARGWSALQPAIQPYIDQVLAYLGAIDWAGAINDGLATSVLSLEGVDWGAMGTNAGKSVATAFIAGWATQINILSGVFGSSIQDGVSKVKWWDEGVVGLIVSSLKAQIGLIAGVFTGITEEIRVAVLDWFNIDLSGAGLRLAQSLWEGFKSFIPDMPDWGKFFWGDAADPNFNPREHFKIENSINRDEKPTRPITEDRATRERAPSTTVPSMLNGMDQLRGMLQNMNGNLARMTPAQAVDATITDARQDNRAFPISAPISITQNITEAQAPTAAGQATGQAVQSAVTNQAARIQQEPAF